MNQTLSRSAQQSQLTVQGNGDILFFADAF